MYCAISLQSNIVNLTCTDVLCVIVIGDMQEIIYINMKRISIFHQKVCISVSTLKFLDIGNHFLSNTSLSMVIWSRYLRIFMFLRRDRLTSYTCVVLPVFLFR